MKHYYGHLSKYAKGIKKGVRINQEKVIGHVGMTGFTAGAQLEFRIKYNRQQQY
jgi:murein DD-endopeptidase MepM/ murein hydrolase activator NlpD